MQPDAQPPAVLQITEEDVQESAPRVRALLVARLESMWEPVRVTLLRDADAQPIDPRMLEIGLRICKELGLHYRLYRPPVVKADDEDDPLGPGVDRASLIEDQLQEIEAKMRSQGT